MNLFAQINQYFKKCISTLTREQLLNKYPQYVKQIEDLFSKYDNVFKYFKVI